MGMHPPRLVNRHGHQPLCQLRIDPVDVIHHRRVIVTLTSAASSSSPSVVNAHRVARPSWRAHRAPGSRPRMSCPGAHRRAAASSCDRPSALASGWLIDASSTRVSSAPSPPPAAGTTGPPVRAG